MKSSFIVRFGQYCAMAMVAILAAPALRAGEPTPPEKPAAVQPSTYRPYKEAKELQDVLFFENFEHAVTSAEKGKVASDDPQLPGVHFWKMELLKDYSWMQVHLTPTQVRFPQGLNPAQIFIQATILAEDVGTVSIKVIPVSGGEFTRDMPVPKAKLWSVVTFKLGDLRNGDKARFEPDLVVKDIEFFVKPFKGKKAANASINDILITVNTNPTDIKPRVLAAEKRRLDMERQYDRDGFVYSMAINDYLKAGLKAVKARVKAKHVVVLAPTPELTLAWAKQLKAAALKLKDNAYTFDAAEDPSPSAPAGTPSPAAGSPSGPPANKVLGGLADSRALLPYNLQKEPQFMVLVVSAEEALGKDRVAEILKVDLERALDAGTVPIVCLPNPVLPEEKPKPDEKVKPEEKPKPDDKMKPEDKAKLEEKAKLDEKDRLEAIAKAKADETARLVAFNKNVEATCVSLGVTVVDAGHAAKSIKGEFDPSKAGTPAFDKTVDLVMAAIKHIHDNLAKE